MTVNHIHIWQLDKDNHRFTYRLKIPYDPSPTEKEMGHEAIKKRPVQEEILLNLEWKICNRLALLYQKQEIMY